jgi:hypothetical protein
MAGADGTGYASLLWFCLHPRRAEPAGLALYALGSRRAAA